MSVALARRLSGRDADRPEANLRLVPPPITASGSPLSISTGGSMNIRRERQAWQKLAWKYYRSVGICWYLSTFKSNAISRLRIFPAKLRGGGQDPIALDDPLSVQQATLDDMASGFASNAVGYAAMLGSLALQWEVPGECYWWASSDQEGNNTHKILSITELEPMGSSGFQYRPLPTMRPQVINPETDFITRLWQPDAEFQEFATSPLMAQLDTLEEMFWLIQDGIAKGKSRISTAGVMTLADELDFKGSPKPDGSLTAFEEEFQRVGSAALKDHRSPARWLPFILRGQVEYLKPDALRWFAPPGQSMDDIARLKELREFFTQDMNLPSGISNLGDMTHWNAWIVDAMVWPHLKPIAVGILSTLSHFVYQPFLMAKGMSSAEAAENVIWFDESEVVTPPDRSASATTGVQLGYLGGEAWRRSNGFEENDAPTLSELARSFGIHWADPGLAGTGDWSKATGRIATRVTEAGKPGEGPVAEVAGEDIGGAQSGPAGFPQNGAGFPTGPVASSSGPQPPGVGGRPATAPNAGPAPAQHRSVVASAGLTGKRAKLARLGPRLSAIDRDLLSRISVLGDTKLQALAKNIGGRLRSASKGRPLVMEQIREVKDQFVASRLGPAKVHALGVDDHRLIAAAAAEFASTARPWIAAGQAAAVRRIATATDQDYDSLDAATSGDRSDWLDASEALLVAGFAKAASAFVFSADPAVPAKGEISDLVAPRSAIRQALTTAGGADRGANGPALGIGGGPMAAGLLANGGAMVSSWVWDYTDSARTTFPGHLALDGTEFSSWDDPALATQPEDDWIGDFYAPGDHDGCACDVTQTLVPVEDFGDDAEAEDGEAE